MARSWSATAATPSCAPSRNASGPRAWTQKVWDNADAVFDPSDEDEAGRWRFKGRPLEKFDLAWGEAKFHGQFTPFRHLAFFPEQAANWAWQDARVRAIKDRQPKVLNLFGYTGVASLVCAAAGAAVTHVDASKKSVGFARENAAFAGLADKPIRWIVEDARRFVAREVRRGSHMTASSWTRRSSAAGPTARSGDCSRTWPS
jgi:23S rRNA (cytosine1962-C5)-methyltransferase